LETAIAIIDASADFMNDTKRLVLVSVFYFFVSMIIFFLWVFAVACVFSMVEFGDPKTKGSQVKTFNRDEIPGKIWAMFGFLAFGLLWITQFINDKGRYITMVSASTYYFNNTAEKEGHASLSTAFSFAYMKNCGSLAFGSLILTLVKILRAMVEAAAKSADKEGDGAAKLVACIAQCLMSCLESIVEYLSKIAYAYMAVTGDTFCDSAWNGFLLNLKHLAKFYFSLQIAGLFVFMGIVTITCINTFLGYAIAMYIIKDGVDAASLAPALACFGVISFLVAVVTLGTFDEAVLSTMICFAIDCDLNDGHARFGPKSYHEKLRAIYGDDYGTTGTAREGLLV
jgi:hypothetical protein